MVLAGVLGRLPQDLILGLPARLDRAARETGWQRLMRALAAAGNRAEALRAYAQCKKLLADELGVAPSPETEATARGLRARGSS